MTDETIFAVALEKSDPAERSAYLDAACGDDPNQRKRVEGLLAALGVAGMFLERPPVAVAESDPDHAPTRPFHAPGADPGNGSTYTTDGDSPVDSDNLSFLAPAGRPHSLGRIGHYEVLEVLGRGGFGIVFRAFDYKLQRVVAVKVLSPSMAATSPARKRFLREARSAALIQHENVVRVHDVSRDDEPLPYLVMEFIPGETLQHRLDRTGPLDIVESIRIARQIAEGLAAAHEKGLVHRDIKPSNILIDTGPQQHVKITDFGLARAADDASLTRSGVVAGTPMYMAPEQAKGESLDHRADLFSLGSVMYAILAGRPPFRAENTPAVLKRVTDDNPRPMREVIPEIPEWLCRIVEKLHAKEPTQRFQTAREVADLLADCERQLQAHKELKNFARIPTAKPDSTPFRPRRVATILAILVVIGAALAVVMLKSAIYRYAGNLAEVGFTSTDPDVDKLLIRRNGELVATLDRTNPRTALAPGEYEVEAVCINGYEATKFHVDSSGLRSTSGSFERVEGRPVIKLTVRRGEAATVIVTAEKRAAPPPAPPSPDKDGWVPLLNGRDLTGWKSVQHAADHDPNRAFEVQGDVLVVRGTPYGFLQSTVDLTGPFALRYQWRGTASGRPTHTLYFHEYRAPNSFPKGVKVSVTTEEASIVLPTNTGEARAIKPVRPGNEWQDVTITYNKGSISASVNGVRAVEARCDGFAPSRIVLESVNSNETHFRKIEVKELPPSPPLPALAVAPFDATKAKEHQEAWAKHLGVQVEYENPIGMKFRLIPAGEFAMGCSPEEVEALRDTPEFKARPWAWSWISGSEQARRTTVAEPFYMGIHEVTVGQFQQFVAAKKYTTVGEKNGGGLVWNPKGGVTRAARHVWNDPKFVGSESHPVGFVALADAKAFCAWLSERDGLRYVVPTEIQWEFACRAGTTARWSFGNAPEAMKQHGWTTPHADDKYHPVGRLTANPFGLFDLYGNACELALEARGELVERGGDVRQSALWAQSATRSATITDPNATFQHGGFRVAIVGDLKAKPGAKEASNPTAIQALRDAVAAKGRTVADVRKRFEAGIVSKLELLAAQVELRDAQIKLAEAEADEPILILHLRELVKLREEELALIAIRVKEGVDRMDLLNQAEGRLADARARLAKVKPPEIAPAPRAKP